MENEQHVKRFEHRALNLKKVAGPALESRIGDFEKEGYEAVCTADGYLIFKQPVAVRAATN